MSYSLSVAAIAQFDQMVKHDYQARGFDLKPFTRFRGGVVGSTLRYPKMGVGMAHKRTTPQSDVIPMNVAHDNVTLTMEDWEAPEYTDIFSQAKVNFDEKAELSSTIANAIGRRQDQQIIDELANGTYTANVNQVGIQVGSTGPSDVNLNTAKLRKAKRYLDEQNVDSDGRCVLIHASQLESMLGTTETTSSDFANVKALIDGELKKWLGFTFIVIGDRPEGGLPLAAGDRSCYAWHKSALGFAENMSQRVTVDWIPHKTSWLCNGIWSAGAKIIDNTGIVEILCDDSAGAAA